MVLELNDSECISKIDFSPCLEGAQPLVEVEAKSVLQSLVAQVRKEPLMLVFNGYRLLKGSEACFR